MSEVKGLSTLGSRLWELEVKRLIAGSEKVKPKT